MMASLPRIASGCAAVIMLAAASQTLAANGSAANESVGVQVLDPAFWLPLQAVSNQKDGIMFVQESNMSRLHRQWGRYGQSRGTYFYNSGPLNYLGNQYCHDGLVFYAQRHDNSFAPNAGYVNDSHAAWKRSTGSRRVILWHQHGRLAGFRAEDVLQVPENIQLSEQLQTRVEALFKEYGPKIAELQEKQVNVLTGQQKQALASVEDVNDAKKLRESVSAAVKLTDEQKNQLLNLQRAMTKLTRESSEKLLEMLTDKRN